MISGASATVQGKATAEFAYGDLLGATAAATAASKTVQIDDATANDAGADAQVDYVAGSATVAATAPTGTSIATTTRHIGGSGPGSGGGGSYSSSGSITGIVWEDSNGDGMLDNGEAGIAGVSVELLSSSGSVLDTTETSSTGTYSFTELSNGQYAVLVTTVESFTQPGLGTTSAPGSVFDPIAGMTAVTISDGQAVTGLDAGLYTPVSVEGTLFVDANDSGYFQSPDAVLSGDTVALENGSGAVLQTTSTANGLYEFAGLAPGSYQVSVGEPLGYQFTTEYATGNPSLDCGVNFSGQSATVSLTDSSAPATINAGVTVQSGTGSISGTVTSDATGSAAAAAGVAVQLIDAGSGTVLQTATTNSSGNYSFGSLIAGSYSVSVQSNETIASGGAFSATSGTASVTVASGQTVSGVNAALGVPEQMTFSLEGYSGTISYSVPWNEVNSSDESQSISLSDFSITIGSQTFYQSSTTFSTAPSINFANGVLTGLTFALNPSASGLPYNSVSTSGGFVLSAFDTNTNSLLSTELAGAPSVTLDFSSAYYPIGEKDSSKDGTLDGGKLIAVVTWGGQGGPYVETYTITCSKGVGGAAVCANLTNDINTTDADGPYAFDRTGGIMLITGTNAYPLQSVVVTAPGKTSEIQYTDSNGATCTIN